MSLTDIASTSQGPMVGDYISTSFNGAGTAATVFAVGKPHTAAVFDEGMWAPTSLLSVASAASATNASSSAGVEVQTGFGPGEAVLHRR
jgi:hypothetical protein